MEHKILDESANSGAVWVITRGEKKLTDEDKAIFIRIVRIARERVRRADQTMSLMVKQNPDTLPKPFHEKMLDGELADLLYDSFLIYSNREIAEYKKSTKKRCHRMRTISKNIDSICRGLWGEIEIVDINEEKRKNNDKIKNSRNLGDNPVVPTLQQLALRIAGNHTLLSNRTETLAAIDQISMGVGHDDVRRIIAGADRRNIFGISGYVNGHLLRYGREWGRIHINFDTLYNEIFSAHVLIHEASHKFCETKDYAYSVGTLRWDRAFSHDFAYNNADSYARFVMRS